MANIITISADIKQKIAERVIEQAHPGYVVAYMGQWYVVNGCRLMHYACNQQWKPWQSDDNVISVDDLVWLYGGGESDNADFHDYETDQEGYDIAIDFALGYVPDSYDADDYAARYEVA